MIRRLVVLALLVGGALLLAPLRVATEGVIAPQSLFLFGILLLAADTLGELAHALHAPRILGCLAAGVILGPSVLAVVPAGVVHDLAAIKRLAVGLIGLLAGMELRVGELRQRWRTVVGVVGAQLLLVPGAILLLTLVAHDRLPFAAGLPAGAVVAVGLVLGTLLAVNSPMVTLALLTETRAAGPLAKTVLGIVLVADVAVIVALSAALSVAQGALGAGAPALTAVVGAVARDLGASLAAGVVLGGLVSLYLRYVRRELVLFAVFIVFATAGAALGLHFELMLSLLVAGFLVENVAPVRAEPLLGALERIAGPVFVVFFALAGAEVPLATFVPLWPAILLIALVRLGGVWAAAWVGTSWGGVEPVVRRYAWLGMVSQAGVALGLAMIVAERLPGFGAGIQLVTVGVIALNETAGAVLFRLALSRGGELAEAPLRAA